MHLYNDPSASRSTAFKYKKPAMKVTSRQASLIPCIIADINLATVDRLKYYVCRYEGSLNGIEDPVVLITYPRDTLHIPKAPRTFISMESS